MWQKSQSSEQAGVAQLVAWANGRDRGNHMQKFAPTDDGFSVHPPELAGQFR